MQCSSGGAGVLCHRGAPERARADQIPAHIIVLIIYFILVLVLVLILTLILHQACPD